MSQESTLRGTKESLHGRELQETVGATLFAAALERFSGMSNLAYVAAIRAGNVTLVSGFDQELIVSATKTIMM